MLHCCVYVTAEFKYSSLVHSTNFATLLLLPLLLGCFAAPIVAAAVSTSDVICLNTAYTFVAHHP